MKEMSKMREDPFDLPCAAPIAAEGTQLSASQGQPFPSWHTLSHSYADSLAFPAARVRMACLAGTVHHFKHAEA